jgi:2-polyprenyl-3-methyl-5-hydroxy-6-metoxy-1,4-benzoquinol methylase
MSIQNKLHQNKDFQISCTDHTVSKEKFDLYKNQEYDILVTKPIPENIGSYYKSEDYISHTDSKKSLFDKVYQLVKNFTLNRKEKFINKILLYQNSEFRSEKKLLDIGAGTGDFLKYCKEKDWQVFGTEPDLGARTIASKKGIFLEEELSNIGDTEFDIITLWHVLEHVEDLEEYIQKLKKLLSESGKLIIAVPNYKSYDANYYKSFWAAYDVPRHLWHFSQKGIEKLFSEFGFILENTKPMKFDCYYVSLLSEKYKTGKMNPFKGFYRGFLSNLKAKRNSEYSSLIYVFKKQ